MKENIKKTLDGIIDIIMSDVELPKVLKNMAIVTPDNIPSSKWSFGNRFTMYMFNTFDARTYHQWNLIGRYPKKGSKAFAILGPILYKEEDHEKLCGFRAIPVFRYEDTDGEPLEYLEELKKIKVSINSFPLIDVAKELNIAVIPSISSFGEMGCYDKTNKAIEMCSNNITTFFHELSHAVDDCLGNISKEGRDLDEIVAELSSALLTSIYDGNPLLEYTRRYIKNYAGSTHPGIMITKALNRVEKIFDYISSHTHAEQIAS